MFKRVLCLFAAFTVLFCCSVPAFATGMTPGGVGGGVAGIPVVGEIQLDVVDFSRYCDDKVRGYGNFIWHLIDNDVCSHAPQLGGSHNFVPRRTQVDGQIGTYYVCEYCGRASGEVLEEAYSEYVSENIGQGTQYDSQGRVSYSSSALFWSLSDFWLYAYESGPGWSPYVRVKQSGYPAHYTAYPSGKAVWSTDEVVLDIPSLMSDRSKSDGFSCTGYVTIHVPCASTFTYSFDVLIDGTYFKSFSGSFLADSALDKVVSFSLGSFPQANIAIHRYKVVSAACYLDPVSTSDVPAAFEARVGAENDSSTGFYGYVQDGQLYQSTTRDIFNETTNTYNNPVTGDTSNVENWTYDYSDRSYTLTTDEGDTVTVTYGDTNVTINDGGTTYNVYYLTEHDESVPEHHYTSSVTLAPTCTGTGVRTYTCDDCGDTYTETIPATGHDYQSVVTMSPSCINTGVRTFTCSVCGDAYTVSIPATGHTWHVLQTVPTVYDEGGQLVTEGYTLYQCATCGEQYKITADSGGASLPSPSGGGTSTDTGASLIELDPHVGRGFLATIAHGLTEDLPEVLKSASAWFTEFPAFYSGFTAFLRDGIAGCLPDIVRKTMGFGLSMVTFVGVVRKIIGR